jgi:uncharacterized membrane protein YeaQ/YmgE (transglycosylase-associated protein family)
MHLLLFILLIGDAAGYLADRQMDVPAAVALGVAGAAVGWVVLRFLVAGSGRVALGVGAVIGAALQSRAWQMDGPRR